LPAPDTLCARFSVEQVAARMARQSISDRTGDPQPWCILDEGVLHRAIGGAVDLWPCESSESNERWYWPPSAAGGGSFTPGLNPIQTRVSGSTGFCLDIPDAQATPGLQMQTWRCNGTRAQLFWVLQ
jgi:hypothetical protein